MKINGDKSEDNFDKLAKCIIEIEYDGTGVLLCFDDVFIRKLAQRVDEIKAGYALSDKFGGVKCR